MDYAALATSIVGGPAVANSLLNTTTGIPAVLTAFAGVIVLTAGIKWFFKLKSRVGL